MERLGIVDDIRAERAAILANVAPRHRARILGRPAPYAEPKRHEITVNLKTGERTVSVPTVFVAPKKRQRVPKLEDVGIYVARGLPRLPREEAMKLIDAVGVEWEVSHHSLTSPTRVHRTSRPRFACYWLLAQRLRFSLPRIGRLMGNRDHTTVLHGIRRAKHLFDHDPDWRRRYDAVVSKLEKGDRT